MAVLNSLGLATAYGLTVNLSVAIVAMVNHTAVTQVTARVRRNATGCGYDDDVTAGDPVDVRQPTGFLKGAFR